VIAAFLIGAVLGATLFGTMQFPYKIGQPTGAASMTPNEITVDLGTLLPGSTGTRGRGIGVAQITISDTEVPIKHSLAGDLNSFDSFSVTISYWNATDDAYFTSVTLYYIGGSLPTEILNVPAGSYKLSLRIWYTVSADATIGIEGTVKVELSY
jgi:hypothetical protein